MPLSSLQLRSAGVTEASSEDAAMATCLGNILSKSLEWLTSVQTFHCDNVDREVLTTPSGLQ